MGLPPDELPSETSKVPEVYAGSPGGEAQAATGTRSSDDAGHSELRQNDENQSAAQRLAEARRKFLKKNNAHYPPANGYEAGMQFDFLQEFQEGAIFKRIKIGKVSVAVKGAKTRKIQFRREWFQPLAWFMDNISWSSSHFAGDGAPERRKTSATFVELACLADILTGGAIGPRQGTYEEKAAIIREGIKHLMKKAKVANATKTGFMAADRFLHTLPNVCSAAPLGFATLPGVSRRPILAKFPGAHTAVGALLNYARAEEDVLATVMPRYFWFKPIWKADTLLSTWEQIMAKRAGEDPQVDVLVPNLQPLRLQPVGTAGGKDPQQNTVPAESNGNQETSTAKRRRTARQGPCVFGCTESNEHKQGRPVWRCVPSPSPWRSIAAGATVCYKCYNRAMVIVRRRQRSGDSHLNIDPDPGLSGTVQSVIGPEKEDAEVHGAIQSSVPEDILNDSQTCTVRAEGSVHDNSDEVTIYQTVSKRRKIGGAGRDVDQTDGMSSAHSGNSFLTEFFQDANCQGLVDVRPICTDGCAVSFLESTASRFQKQASTENHAEVEEDVEKMDAKSSNFNVFLDKQCDVQSDIRVSNMAAEPLYGIISRKKTGRDQFAVLDAEPSHQPKLRRTESSCGESQRLQTSAGSSSYSLGNYQSSENQHRLNNAILRNLFVPEKGAGMHADSEFSSCETFVHPAAISTHESMRTQIGAQSADDGFNTVASNLADGVGVHASKGYGKKKASTSAHSQGTCFVLHHNSHPTELEIASAGTASGTGRAAREAMGAVTLGEGGMRSPEPALEVSACTALYPARPPGHMST